MPYVMYLISSKRCAPRPALYTWSSTRRAQVDQQMCAGPDNALGLPHTLSTPIGDCRRCGLSNPRRLPQAVSTCNEEHSTGKSTLHGRCRRHPLLYAGFKDYNIWPVNCTIIGISSTKGANQREALICCQAPACIATGT